MSKIAARGGRGLVGRAALGDHAAMRDADPDIQPDTAPADSPENPAGRGLYMHLGVHRTGTSSFQEFLALNQAVLEEAGFNLAVANRDSATLSSLKLRLPDPRHFRRNDLEERREFLLDEIGKHRINNAPRTIISEENIPSGFQGLFSDRPYGAAYDRLRFMRLEMTHPVRRVLLVIRSYDSFLKSAYRKRCEFRLIDPFENYVPMALKARRGWFDLAGDILRALEPEALVVLRQEDRPRHSEMLHHLIPETRGLPLRDIADQVNVSPTDAACRAMQAIFAEGRKLGVGATRRLIADYADDKSGPSIAEFAPEDAQVLRDRYARDLQRIAHLACVEMPGAAAPAT
ncbi:hypothetical protein SAMN05421759_103168 [Roseivivax lentus]|uniref:Uncharacterized protein n=1 Tax=Roseivivax lentus TaxID=633194 RepID=A0A1N7LUJ8_9RHOB|nr:hypothetical protein [Roseivivax lentus]SIS77444.1 hypothetical protein SAMN05421759_103168 [Roseivivax lentus]